MNILCTICARKGSKGLKNKNFLKISQKPLIEYTIDQALNAKIFNNISIYSDKIFSNKFKKKYKNLFFYHRPKYLSKDKVGKVDVIKNLLIKSEFYFKKNYDLIVDLDVTSPLRSTMDIKESLKKIIRTKSNNLISVTTAKKNPYFNMIEIINGKPKLVKKNKPYLTRQEAPKTFEMNASIYIWKRKYLLKNGNIISNKTICHYMPRERSIDIDDYFDFLQVKNIIEKN